MAQSTAQVTVAGNVCLDIIPTWPPGVRGLSEILSPGKLAEVGPAVVSTGGAVSNCGVALHRLGFPVQLMGKVGDDLIGRSILDLLARAGPGLADGMIVAPGEASSYSIVISPPNIDRMFLHCPGANDTFGAADVAYDRLADQRLFHCGYPPLLRRMHAGGGEELEATLRRVKAAGPATSLDMAHVDPASPAGRVDWPGLLRRVMGQVDLFLPSLEETLSILAPGQLDRIRRQAGTGEPARQATGELLAGLADQLLGWGAAVVALKLGDQGLYLRTTGSGERLGGMGAGRPADPDAWLDRELLAPCFAVEVVGTTGSGDCTIAGLLAGLLEGLGPEAAMTAAVAVGACCVEQTDATSGVSDWSVVQERIRGGWERRPVAIPLPGWRWDDHAGVWIGPNDAKGGRVPC